jgi:U32 family peptidase
MIFGFFKRKPKEENLEEIGEVTHYFPHVKAGIIKLNDQSSIGVGEVIRIKGSTTDFKQKVVSLQIDHKPIQKATKGKEIGLKVKKRVRQGDKIYKV